MTTRVVFPFLAQFHQILHSLPIAVQLVRRHPDIEVHVIGATAAHMDFVRELIERHAQGTVLHEDGCLRIGWFDRQRVARGATIRRKRYALLRNRGYFRSFDAVVTPERSSLFLKHLHLPDTRLIWTRHGAGDRQVGFAGDIARFDFVLLAGRKIEQRLLERELIRPGDYVSGVYAKFDWMDAGTGAPRLFDNDRPTVLYTPHFRPALSSWPIVGRAVLDHFAASTRYNLIFAPHVRLFDPPTPECYAPFAAYRRLPHMHVDLGSTRSIDMSYTGAADIYLGDVSSQVAEFLYRPRPCVFINAHGIDWQDDPNYRFWTLGPVIGDVAGLDAGIESAVARHCDYESAQRQYFDDSFGTMPGQATAARGADAIVNFLKRSKA
jgi:hypothetical protein